ncbi:hypothetical protein MSHOH_2992 [Methanosarcina horonobensis HB-1 = JCM 15518]|uniref:Uncharacterized protein n=1 Tax=Methanosarcina horonobensis HB-1 = JCM 15518 TaxID=1434110 RepID=A0A0E3WWG0_9EURY|nr:hypothetical protein MSHOH_2992 [Methanosarcina horonobensis HB-1 = JCM 15518]
MISRQFTYPFSFLIFLFFPLFFQPHDFSFTLSFALLLASLGYSVTEIDINIEAIRLSAFRNCCKKPGFG